MDHTRINIILGASMFYCIIDQLIGDEDKSASPESMYMVSIEYLSDKVTNNFRLAMISSELDLAVNLVYISKRGKYFRHRLRIVLMCYIDFNHDNNWKYQIF